MRNICKSINCGLNPNHNENFYPIYATAINEKLTHLKIEEPVERMSEKYPHYFKDVSALDEIDVYQVHQLFEVTDPSGALQHASKKLLLSGVRTGGKTKFQDIQEARDTLNRWLEINSPELV